jgi:PAS domain S-box-containing protein
MSAQPTGELHELAALRSIVQGTAAETGERFFAALVENLKSALGTSGAWVAVFDEQSRALRAVSMKIRDKWVEGFSYTIEGTPCESAIRERRLVHIPDRIVELYASDPALRAHGAVSYLGAPLLDASGRIIGQLAVLDDKPMPAEPRSSAIFQIFASRAAAELRRLGAEQETRQREAQLRRLLDSAMDAIVNLDDGYRVALMNPAAARLFDYPEGGAVGQDFRYLLQEDAFKRFLGHAEPLKSELEGKTSLWIAGGLRAVSRNGRDFQVEASLSHFVADGRAWFTLILRDLEDRLAAERKIRTLEHETEYLKDELRSLQSHEPIIGSSRALRRALRQVEQVAPTETTVLLLGETGTGKELFARALHASGTRRDRRLVRVNCGAIPANLIESELFGHERGAFTGATHRREGRFTLAHGGTIFLDEIGELPLELQPKLLRVLQEGEFEPVGSSHTIKVDARIVAATHQNLAERVRRGTFREDLYYRLNVFPITVPPLRERKEDIPALAQAFLERFSRRLGRSMLPLSDAALARLAAYAWPGNVRELANVIERGIIISNDPSFDIERALFDPTEASPLPVPAPERAQDPEHILSATELAALERKNLIRALDASGWKVSGERGAAALLELNASTLSSRMRALGIRRKPR